MLLVGVEACATKPVTAKDELIVKMAGMILLHCVDIIKRGDKSLRIV